MLKRTLFFSKRGHIRMAMEQLLYEIRVDNQKETHRFPLEDVGCIVIESTQITLTAYALQALAGNNTSVIFCDTTGMPSAFMLPHASHTLTQRHVADQLAATEALKNRLWRQTVAAKIINQAACLRAGGKDGAARLRLYLKKIKSGDSGNCEAQAAKAYFAYHADGRFQRNPEGGMPNPALNYGYAILRAATARALVGSGLIGMVGIHHHNQYNDFALADDIMEPYRPFVDDIVLNQPKLFPLNAPELTRLMKAALLSVLAVDVQMGALKRPLMNALSMTTASLVRCLQKKETIIAYPTFPSPCRPTPP